MAGNEFLHIRFKDYTRKNEPTPIPALAECVSLGRVGLKSSLVPDERLLPPESLRFFSLDPDWMGCLVHGAFSIGANAGTNHWSGESEQHPVTANLTADKPVDGFLLKSEVVSGYPGMDIEVYETANSTTPLPILRRQLAPDTILCLYEGAAQQVRFHLKPDVLHFGFDETETSLVKYLNGADAMQSETSTVVEVDAASRVVNIATLFDAAQTYWHTNPRAESAFKEFGSGHFALALLEGVAQVNYNRKES
ncbi:MAG: hypothetical protein H7319_03085 [Spirosoma sp.]|nr:hypothetical protein [Spirosoma sp.]